jgi:hypothetical protein
MSKSAVNVAVSAANATGKRRHANNIVLIV